MCIENIDEIRNRCKDNKLPEVINRFLKRYGLIEVRYINFANNNTYYNFKVLDDDNKTTFIYINIACCYNEFNDSLWHIGNFYEGVIFTLLHELGHIIMQPNNSEAVTGLDKWGKLTNSHESIAWLWAFNFRHEHRTEYNYLIENFRNFYNGNSMIRNCNRAVEEYEMKDENIEEHLGAWYFLYKNYIIDNQNL